MSDTFEFDDRNHAERFVGTLHDPQATVGDVLTVQADKSIAAKPGGGGGSGVQVVTVPVSSAQILDLFNTPVTLVAGVAGKAIIPDTLSIAYVPGLIPYLDGGGNLQVNPNSWQAFPTVNFWDQATAQIWSPGFTTGTGGGAAASSALYAGIDLELIETVANPTLGDGTLLVTLSYFLAPTA